MTKILIEFTLIGFALYGYYRILLARQPQLTFNRGFLLLLIPISAAMAWVEFPAALSFTGIPSIDLPETLILGESDSETTLSGIGWIGVLYGLGAGISASIWGHRIWRIRQFIQQHPHESRQGYTLIFHDQPIGPASFMGFILWPKTLDIDSAEGQQILAHESCHVRQYHTLDILGMILLMVLMWFHPLVYLVRRELIQVHEFQADKSAALSFDPRQYGKLLIAQSFSRFTLPVHTFFQSPLKIRMFMLTQSSTSRKSWLRYQMLVPFMAVLFVLAACSVKPDEVERKEVLPTMSEVSASPTVTSFEDEPPVDAKIQIDEKPRPLNLTEVVNEIGYPEAAKKNKIEGKVIARILIDEKGKYVKHSILKSINPILDETIAEKLPMLRFDPAKKDGKPVKFWVNIPFNFKL